MELPKWHHYTRWWLRRHGGDIPSKVILYDRAMRVDVGESMRYPEEFDEALQQLRMLRQRDGEVIDKFVFCDGLGNS